MLIRAAPSCLRSLVRNYFSRCYSTRHAQTFPAKGDRVVIGMSGGVDSSVSAKLLAEQDYDLSAVYMRSWDTRDESGTDEGCEWKKDWEDVQRVCKVLDIPCELIDLSKEYWVRVFEPSLRVWESGQTPNPDVWCNREIKFGALLEHLPIDTRTAQRSWFATGHYAKKSWSNDLRPMLLTAEDNVKDQSYYLSSITESGLARALFPIGDLRKSEVRWLAKKWGLPTAERSESMGLCFVGEKMKFSEFLATYIPPQPGPFKDMRTGKVLGIHQGLWNFTIGENARIPGMLEKMYVARKESNTNTIFVVPRRTNEALVCDTVYATEWKWIWADTVTPQSFQASVRIRHRMNRTPCTVQVLEDGRLKIVMDTPQHGGSPGQVAALWDGVWCLGCGTIESTDKSM